MFSLCCNIADAASAVVVFAPENDYMDPRFYEIARNDACHWGCGIICIDKKANIHV